MRSLRIVDKLLCVAYYVYCGRTPSLGVPTNAAPRAPAMNEPKRIPYPADHWTERGGNPIVAIVCHGTGGGLKSSLSTLKTGDGRGVSIHVLIDKDGTQYVMVPDEKGANHAGAVTSKFTLNGRTYAAGMVNKVTLGVELVNLQDGRDQYPPLQLQSLGWLITHWRALHGPLPILRHADLDPSRRRDPYQLTTQQIEATTMQSPPPPITKRYKARIPAPIFQDRRPDAPLWGYIDQWKEEDTDDLTNGWLHMKSGIGFSPISCWEPV